MNPENNQMTELADLNEAQSFADRFYPNQPRSEVPIFEMREEVVLRGYVFMIIQMAEDRLVLKPLRKATVEDFHNDTQKEGRL